MDRKATETKRKKKIYLSLPISGYDFEERIETVRFFEERLSKDWDVVNPLHNGLPQGSDTHAHMRRDIELLLGCDAIFLMERWTHSGGCKLELDIATAIGLEVYFEECHSVEYGGVRFK